MWAYADTVSGFPGSNPRGTEKPVRNGGEKTRRYSFSM
jgi:hypothetical protein